MRNNNRFVFVGIYNDNDDDNNYNDDHHNDNRDYNKENHAQGGAGQQESALQDDIWRPKLATFSTADGCVPGHASADLLKWTRNNGRCQAIKDVPHGALKGQSSEGRPRLLPAHTSV